MTILYPSLSGVKSGRIFGAGILSPDAPCPDRPFEPAPEDLAWWAVESDRLAAIRAATCARRNRRRSARPAWVYSRSDRFRALLERARAVETYLARERCDAAGSDICTTIDSRLAILARRIRRLCDLARESHRLDRHFDLLATESDAMDAMEHGLIPADVADLISRTSLVGHDA